MKIYLAGKYSGDNIIDILSNIRAGISAAADLIRQGNEVYCPWLDFLIALMPGPTIPKEVYQRNSLSFVEWCDQVVLLPGWEKSGGVKKELARASELGKPAIFYEAKEGKG